jgi:hypothetical protein
MDLLVDDALQCHHPPGALVPLGARESQASVSRLRRHSLRDVDGAVHADYHVAPQRLSAIHLIQLCRHVLG